VTVFGVASMTLTGTTLPSSAKIRVIPSFLPIKPAGTVVVPSQLMAELLPAGVQAHRKRFTS
jgi:hypothetical protein